MNEDRPVHDDQHPGTEELARRLEAYASVRLAPNRAAVQRVRAAVIEEARMRTLEKAIGGTPHRHRRGPSRVVALLLAAALTLAGAVGVAAAANAGGPLYGVRIWVETAMLPADADGRALERIRQIEEPLLDAERAIGAGDRNAIAAAVQAYREAVANALAEVGDDADRLARLQAALGNHVTVLQALAGRLPDAAQTGINNALDASQKGVDKIKDTKPAATQRPEPTQRPDRTERPEPSNRPANTPRVPPAP
jgi:hypothetical protein